METKLETLVDKVDFENLYQELAKHFPKETKFDLPLDKKEFDKLSKEEQTLIEKILIFGALSGQETERPYCKRLIESGVIYGEQVDFLELEISTLATDKRLVTHVLKTLMGTSYSKFLMTLLIVSKKRCGIKVLPSIFKRRNFAQKVEMEHVLESKRFCFLPKAIRLCGFANHVLHLHRLSRLSIERFEYHGENSINFEIDIGSKGTVHEICFVSIERNHIFLDHRCFRYISRSHGNGIGIHRRVFGG